MGLGLRTRVSWSLNYSDEKDSWKSRLESRAGRCHWNVSSDAYQIHKWI